MYAYNNWDWSKNYPVIKISWAGDFSSLSSTKDVIVSVLQDNQERLGIECNNIEQYDICFKELIRKASQKYDSHVVILIDEYDKPILDAIKNPKVAEENRNLLHSLYGIMKDSDQYIRFGRAGHRGARRALRLSCCSKDIASIPHVGGNQFQTSGWSLDCI